MTTDGLAFSYLRKAQGRFRLLAIMNESGDYSDVVREAQELVELCLKGMLRHQAIEPPKWHDVGEILRMNAGRFPSDTQEAIPRLAVISAELRKDRERAFYGDEDCIPTEEFGKADAIKAIDSARFVLDAAERLIRKPTTPPG